MHESLHTQTQFGMSELLWMGEKCGPSLTGRIEHPLHERKTKIISRLLLETIQLKNKLPKWLAQMHSVFCLLFPHPQQPRNDALDDLERIVVNHENTDTYDAHKIEI